MKATRLTAAVLLWSPSAVAQIAGSARPGNPLAGFSAAIAIICVLRRKHAFGGWLLWFLGQVFLGGIVSLYLLLADLRNYLPGAWDQPKLYVFFLLSAIPSYLVVVWLMVAAVAMVRTAAYEWLLRMRIALAVQIFFGLMALAIDAAFFRGNAKLEVVRLVFPAIFLPYLFLSSRVERVFQTKDVPTL
jgi:hypothetical protein